MFNNTEGLKNNLNDNYNLKIIKKNIHRYTNKTSLYYLFINYYVFSYKEYTTYPMSSSFNRENNKPYK